MPTVTAIKPQSKRPDRFSVFIDGQFAIGLSTDELITSGLRLNQVLTEVELAGVNNQIAQNEVYAQAINLFSYRPRSEQEVRRYLERKSVEPDEVEVLIARLKTAGWLDDQQFAQAWLADRNALKPASHRKLQSELRQKGLSDQVIKDALTGYDEQAELQAIKAILAKKQRLSGNLDQPKITAYLLRQGFGFHSIRQAISEFEENDLGSASG